MKIKVVFLTAITFILFLSISSAQDTHTFQHPKLGFSFEASGNWQQNPYHKDVMIYEMINSERDVHVMLWYNGGTEMDCEKYLKKMADMKGLQFKEAEMKNIDGKTIWILDCTDNTNDIPDHKILAAMANVKAYQKDAPERCQGKSYNNMHIAQVWCPESTYAENKVYMEGIVASLELTKY